MSDLLKRADGLDTSAVRELDWPTAGHTHVLAYGSQTSSSMSSRFGGEHAA